MTAKILHFQDWRNKMRKKLNPEFRLYFKHRKLVADAAARGYSLTAIKKLVRSAEDSRRGR